MNNLMNNYINDHMNIIEQKDKLFSARIGKQLFGFPINQIEDIFIPTKITPVPLCVNEVCGVLNLRGRIVTAINMHEILKIKPPKINKKAAINIMHKDGFYGLLIDHIDEVIKVENANISNVPGNIDQNWKDITSGVYQLDEEILVILNVDKIFEIISNSINNHKNDQS